MPCPCKELLPFSLHFHFLRAELHARALLSLGSLQRRILDLGLCVSLPALLVSINVTVVVTGSIACMPYCHDFRLRAGHEACLRAVRAVFCCRKRLQVALLLLPRRDRLTAQLRSLRIPIPSNSVLFRPPSSSILVLVRFPPRTSRPA